jgi:two-component system chemotaxis response regulator CheB
VIGKTDQPAVFGVLVVDASPLTRAHLRTLLETQADCRVLGEAGDGAGAVALAKELRPAVIVMAVRLAAGLDGAQATRQIMATAPTPVILFGDDLDPGDAPRVIEAMNAGVLGIARNPVGPLVAHGPGRTEEQEQFLRQVRLLAGVKMVTRRDFRVPARPPAAAGGAGAAGPVMAGQAVDVVAIGASTGGPVVLQTLLTGLAPGFPWPVLLVQHIASGFAAGLADWLTKTTGKPVRLAVDNEVAEPGRVYLAPENRHMGLTPQGRLRMSDTAPEYHIRPSVGYLFRSIAATGFRAAGVLLTGMGRDGAAELGLIRNRGGLTIAQDEASSVVFGMPGEAVRLGAAEHVLSPAQIIRLLNTCGDAGKGP